jgi:hypothetical protein
LNIDFVNPDVTRNADRFANDFRNTDPVRRIVVFETTETNWHLLSCIGLPAEKKNLSHCSIGLYFYTKAPSAEELAGKHSAICVDRPLSRVKADRTLNDHNVQKLRVLLARRDQHNQRSYRDVLTLRLERTEAAVNAGSLGRRHLARRFGRGA